MDRIPTIDISPLNDDACSSRISAGRFEQVMDAGTQIGFLSITEQRHVPRKSVKNMFATAVRADL